MAQATDIAERIRDYIRADLAPRGEIELDTPLLAGLIDSLELMQVVAFVETEFGISLDFADMSEANFRDVRALERLVLAKMG